MSETHARGNRAECAVAADRNRCLSELALCKPAGGYTHHVWL